MADQAAAPALGFSITTNITDRSQIVVQSFVPLDASDAQINDVLDKVMKACDRQRAKYMLKDMRLLLERETVQAATHVAQIADFQNQYATEHATNGRRGEFELKGSQKTNVENLRKTVAGMNENITRTKANIAELEALAK